MIIKTLRKRKMNRKAQWLFVFGLLISALVVLGATSTQAPDAAYIQSFEKCFQLWTGCR